MLEPPPIDDFIYEQLAQRIVFGWGRLRELPAEADRLAGRRIMLVSQGSAAGAASEARRLLGRRVVAAVERARPHVPRADVDEARALAGDGRVDLIVTLGGGSATGLGKAVALQVSAPLIAIPTTYAGSEVTPIFGTTGSGRKRTGRDDRALPKTVLYDPQLTTSLRARVTATTGMNAVAHAVEALYATDAGPTTRLLAQEAIRRLFEALPVCVESPDNRGARSGALYGACLAGTVLATAGMAIHHRICHVLGGTFGLAHGDVNAVVLPHAVAFNRPAAPEAVTAVADALNASDAPRALFELAASLGAPTSLRDLGMARADLQEAASIVTAESFYNPRPAGFEEVLDLLRAAFEGRAPGAAAAGVDDDMRTT